MTTSRKTGLYGPFYDFINSKEDHNEDFQNYEHTYITLK